MNLNELKIDEEFKRLLPSHTAEEANELKKSVENDGKFTDPLVYWEEEGVLLDGHNRLSLWDSGELPLGINEPETVGVSLPDRTAAKKWVIRHQLGRRNLDKHKRKMLLGELYNEEKKSVGRPAEMGSNEPINPGRTSEAIASATGESDSSVKRAGRLVASINSIGEVDAEVGKSLHDGTLRLSEAVVNKIAGLPDEQKQKAVENLKQEKRWDEDVQLPERKTAKPPKPKQLQLLEQCERLIGSANDAFYEAYRIDNAITKAKYDDAVRNVVKVVRENIKFQKGD